MLAGTPSKSPELNHPSNLQMAKSAIEILLPTKKLETSFSKSIFSRNWNHFGKCFVANIFLANSNRSFSLSLPDRVTR